MNQASGIAGPLYDKAADVGPAGSDLTGSGARHCGPHHSADALPF